MTHRILRISVLMALFAASVFLIPPRDARAAIIDEGLSQVTAQAPFTNKFETGEGMKVKFDIRLGSIEPSFDVTQLDKMRLVAFLYNRGSFTGTTVLSEEDVDEVLGVVRDYTIELPEISEATVYDEVAFVLLFEGNESSTGVSDDFLRTASGDIIDGEQAGFVIIPLRDHVGSVATAFPAETPEEGLRVVALPQYTASPAGPTSEELAAIAEVNEVKAAIQRLGSYTGPKLVGASVERLDRPDELKLTFDAYLSEIADNTVLGSRELVLTSDDIQGISPSDDTQSTETNEIVVNGLVSGTNVDPSVANQEKGRKSIKVDESSSPFSITLEGVQVNPDALISCAAISDAAGNCPPAGQDLVDIVMYQTPSFAGQTADVLLTGGNCVDTSAEVEALYSTSGVECNDGETLQFKLFLREALDSKGIDHLNDIDLKAGNDSLESLLEASNELLTDPVCVNAKTCTLVLTTGNPLVSYVRINEESGQVEIAHNVTEDAQEGNFKAVTLALTQDGDETEDGRRLRTEDGRYISGDTNPENVFTSKRRDLTYKTSDRTVEGADGVLEGVVIEVGHAISNVPGLTPGATLVDANLRESEIASTVSIVSAEDGIVRVTADRQADVEIIAASDKSDLTTATTSETVPPLPYNIQIEDSTLTYELVFNEATGEPDTLPDLTSNATIDDGAAPVVVKVEWQKNLSDPNEVSGRLLVTTSEKIKQKESGGETAIPFRADSFQAGVNEANALGIYYLNLNEQGASDEVTIGDVEGDDRTFVISPAAKNLSSGDLKLFLDSQLLTNIVGVADREQLTVPHSGVAITKGANADTPKILGAFATIDSASGNKTVMVLLDSPVEEVADGQPGHWKIKIGDDESLVQTEQVSVVGNVVTLAIPENGLTPVNNQLVTPVNNQLVTPVNNQLVTPVNNQLVTPVSNPLVGGEVIFTRIDDGNDGVPESGIKRAFISENNIPAYLENGSSEIKDLDESLLVQRVTGKLSGSDTESGMLLRAFGVAPMPVPQAGPGSVCTVTTAIDNYSNHTHTAELQFKDSNGSVRQAILAGQQTVPLTLVVDVSEDDSVDLLLRHQQLTQTESTSDEARIPVTLDVLTGNITGENVQDGCELEVVRSLAVISEPSMYVVPPLSDADVAPSNFDMIVTVDEKVMQLSQNYTGSNTSGCVFMTAEWWETGLSGNLISDTSTVKAFTSCDPGVGTLEQGGNHVPFTPAVFAQGEPSTIDVDVDLSDIETFNINDTGEWQMVSMVAAQRVPGEPGGEVRIPELFVCATADGGAVSVVSDHFEKLYVEEYNVDELSTLHANHSESFIELKNSASSEFVIDTFTNDDIGRNFAFLFRQESGGQEGACSYLKKDGDNGNFDLGQGWTLAKIGSNCGPEVTAIIVMPENDATGIATGADEIDNLLANTGEATTLNIATGADEIDNLLANAGTNGSNGVVAFIHSPDGMENFDACSL